jgi:hypothetical protein
MDEVERQISLPKGAQPLAAYTRYYASAPNGEVVAVYLLPGLQRRECNDEMSSECPPLDGTRNLKAGERLWVDNSARLPRPTTYGCAVVNVAFNPDAAQVTQASCGGAS